MKPSETRLGKWQVFEAGVVRIDFQKGFDCTKSCEHERKQSSNHGLSGDDWVFAARHETMAITLRCFSRIYNSKELYRSPTSQPLVYGAWLHLHDGRIPNRACEFLAQGCSGGFVGCLLAEELFRGFDEVVVPYALRPLETIDDTVLVELSSKLPRLWRSLFQQLSEWESELSDFPI